MSAAEKLAYAMDQQWRPATTRCSTCGFTVLVGQLGDHHRDRCPGHPLVGRGR
jgi:hypothetical protein